MPSAPTEVMRTEQIHKRACVLFLSNYTRCAEFKTRLGWRMSAAVRRARPSVLSRVLHLLQSARHAVKADLPEKMVLACLLHDISVYLSALRQPGEISPSLCNAAILVELTG
jgi:hypothetical protein